MILAEPPPSQADVHFRVLGFPVRIHPFFWVVALLLGIQGKESPPAKVLVWVAALFISVLVHELGHALVQRRYGGRSRIVLYGMGGLAISEGGDRSTWAQILISFAGPGAGFIFAILILFIVRASGHISGVSLGNLSNINLPVFNHIDLLGVIFYWQPFISNHINQMVGSLLMVNVLWGAINLLPIYPLDGGQISRELCLLGQPRKGMVLSLQISIVTAIAMALIGISWQSLLAVLMFGYLAYSSYRALEAYRASLW